MVFNPPCLQLVTDSVTNTCQDKIDVNQLATANTFTSHISTHPLLEETLCQAKLTLITLSRVLLERLLPLIKEDLPPTAHTPPLTPPPLQMS